MRDILKLNKLFKSLYPDAEKKQTEGESSEKKPAGKKQPGMPRAEQEAGKNLAALEEKDESPRVEIFYDKLDQINEILPRPFTLSKTYLEKAIMYLEYAGETGLLDDISQALDSTIKIVEAKRKKRNTDQAHLRARHSALPEELMKLGRAVHGQLEHFPLKRVDVSLHYVKKWTGIIKEKTTAADEIKSETDE
ncbi:MAG: hypothetical protein HQ530_02825 [Parcubacteria group bacterium]|nr:hypothetical protein [Parcubacteria group bacterium]